MGILDSVKGIPIKECGEGVEVLTPSDFVIDPKYFEWSFSDTEEVLLRASVIEKLNEAKALLPEGWNFKIWDGYRTLSTQEKVYKNYWDRLKKENPAWDDEKIRENVEIFVSPASEDVELPSPHNTGGTVDLTLVDENGEEVDMGTPFDEFTPNSYTDHFKDSLEGSKEATWHKNRMLLLETLEELGFKNYYDEWWHFSYGTQEWASQTGNPIAFYGSIELLR